MFSIESLWKNEKLAPLKKAHDADPMDRRLVVVIDADNSVNIAETELLHGWLEKQSYQRIPDTWETDELDTLQVIHVSQLSIEVLRRDPFSSTSAPLTPNSWLSKLPQERFDALLLAQQQGDVPHQPTKMYLKDTLKPSLEAEKLSSFWSDTVGSVKFAQSGAAPKNATQKKVLADWAVVLNRRHYDPTSNRSQSIESSPVAQQDTVVRSYVWFDNGMYGWNQRLTALRNWISQRTSDENELRSVAQEVLGFGWYVRVNFTGRVSTTAHSLVEQAMHCNKLNELASYYKYEQQPTSSAFNQSGQTVHGQQVNISTGGGDFVGRDKYNVTIANARGVAIGGNISQTTIITGDDVVINRRSS